MPLQNRVDPYSQIHAVPQRMSYMGNRGCIHNKDQQIKKFFSTKRWIFCLLSFKNWHRPLMKEGQYTELFFLDEVTALAAGHRPCAECQRAKHMEFKQHWFQANNLEIDVVAVMDNHIHEERMAKQKPMVNLLDLPDGTMVEIDDQPYVIYKDFAWQWSFEGYKTKIKLESSSVQLITPSSIVNALKHGYIPNIELKI